MQDAIAEILSVKIGDHKGAYIRFNIAKSSFGFMFKTTNKVGMMYFLKSLRGNA